MCIKHSGELLWLHNEGKQILVQISPSETSPFLLTQKKKKHLFSVDGYRLQRLDPKFSPGLDDVTLHRPMNLFNKEEASGLHALAMHFLLRPSEHPIFCRAIEDTLQAPMLQTLCLLIRSSVQARKPLTQRKQRWCSFQGGGTAMTVSLEGHGDRHL